MVYVDDVTVTIPSARWPWHSGCHLFGDSEKEVRAMAFALGIDQSYFIGSNPGFPHFMIRQMLRDRAIAKGAKPVTDRFVREFCKRNFVPSY